MIRSLVLVFLTAVVLVDCGHGQRPTTQTASCPKGSISADNVSLLKQDLGTTATVDGTIVLTHYAPTEEGQPTFLDFHNPYQGYFEVVIWVENRKAFSSPPEGYYLNRHVCVTGTVSSYVGPEIRVTSPSQIVVIGS